MTITNNQIRAALLQEIARAYQNPERLVTAPRGYGTGASVARCATRVAADLGVDYLRVVGLVAGMGGAKLIVTWKHRSLARLTELGQAVIDASCAAPERAVA